MNPFAFWYPVSTGYLNCCYQIVIRDLLSMQFEFIVLSFYTKESQQQYSNWSQEAATRLTRDIHSHISEGMVPVSEQLRHCTKWIVQINLWPGLKSSNTDILLFDQSIGSSCKHRWLRWNRLSKWTIGCNPVFLLVLQPVIQIIHQHFVFFIRIFIAVIISMKMYIFFTSSIP